MGLRGTTLKEENQLGRFLERREGVLSPEEDVGRFAVPDLCQRIAAHGERLEIAGSSR